MFGKKRTVYLRIYVNELRLKCIENSKISELVANPPFSTTRLLIGEFTAAEALLQDGLEALFGNEWQQLRPRFLVQPMAMLEGGLSSVEQIILDELAASGRSRQTVVHTGKVLTDANVLEHFE